MQPTRTESNPYQPSFLSSFATIASKTTCGAAVGGLVGDFLENQFIRTTLPGLLQSAYENSQNITLDNVFTAISSYDYTPAPLVVQLIGAGGIIMFTIAVYQDRNYRKLAISNQKISNDRLVEEASKKYPKLNEKDVQADLAGIMNYKDDNEIIYTLKSDIEAFAQYICVEWVGTSAIIDAAYEYAKKQGVDPLITAINELRAKTVA